MTSARERSHGSTRSIERGAAVVEMAMVLPVLILLVVGIWATARAWNVHNVMDHAVREGARFGATIDPWTDGSTTSACGVGSSQAEIRCVVDEQLAAAAVPTASVATVCVDLDSNPCAVGSATGSDKVAVSIEWQGYPIDFVFFSVDVDLTATAVARYES